MKKFFKILSCCLMCSILILSLNTKTVFAANTETNGHIITIAETSEDYITSYDFKNDSITTTKLSNFITDNGSLLQAEDSATYPYVPPKNGQTWPNINSNATPRYVFGTGYSWQECDPYIWGVAYIKIYWRNGYNPTRGTAFVIADNALVTSAHCIYNKSKGGWCDYVEVSPARNYNSYPFGTHIATTVYLCTEYMTSATIENDYAVLEVDEAIGQETGWFGWTTSASTGQTITATGYPGCLDNNNTISANWKQYKDIGTITSVTNTIVRSNNIDCNNGSSGGPFYNNNYQAVGIISRESSSNNSATRITSTMSNFFSTFRE